MQLFYRALALVLALSSVTAGVGLSAGGPEPLNTNLNLRRVTVPVIDIYAEDDTDAQFAGYRGASRELAAKAGKR